MAQQKISNYFKEWLEKLQQESWQLELLISGLALFGIFESRVLIGELNYYIFQNFTGLTKAIFMNLHLALAVGWTIFFINLLIHIILRGLWIGAIGLRYVSGEINYEGLNYSKYFTQYLEKNVGEFDNFIERLEKFCSVLFAYTFLLFLIFLSTSLFFIQISVIGWIIKEKLNFAEQEIGVIIILYIFPALLVAIDFITLGSIKKIESPTINKIYGVIYRWFSYSTLSVIYRPLVYNFFDTKYTRRLFIFSIPYIIIVIFSKVLIQSNSYPYFPPKELSMEMGAYIDNSRYEDLRSSNSLQKSNTNQKNKVTRIPDVMLSKFQEDSGLLSFFLKMKPTDFKSLNQDSSLVYFFKQGLNFSPSDNYTDKNISKKTKEKLDNIRSLVAERRDITKKLGLEKAKAARDSISLMIEELNKNHETWTKIYNEQKIAKVLDAFKGLYVFKMDGIKINDACDCYFSVHQNFNEKGLKCIYSIDTLAIGKHEFEYELQEKYLEDESVKTVIPFYITR